MTPSRRLRVALPVLALLATGGTAGLGAQDATLDETRQMLEAARTTLLEAQRERNEARESLESERQARAEVEQRVETEKEEIRANAAAETDRKLSESESILAEIESAREQAEREAILRALDSTLGNRTRAAQRLGMSRQALHARLRRYGIGSGTGRPGLPAGAREASE